MSGDLQLCLCLCTCPDGDVAAKIADQLVAEQLAACVNIVPGIMSVYRWQDEVEHGQEVLLLIKTSKTLWSQLEQRIQALHPYELPEIMAVPITTGQADYIKWIEDSLKSP
jgi:periplasmic divalent cation tolerance protein